MSEYDFTLVLRDLPTPEQEDLIFELFEGDGTLAISEEVARLYFTREAETLEDAIEGARARLEAAGFTVLRAELEFEFP